MNEEDPMKFVQARLRQRHSPLRRELRLREPRRMTRRYALDLAGGSNHVFDRVDGTVMVRCASGSLWITHDGDPKDVILEPQQSYRAQREATMSLHALQPCVVEIEFEDEAAAG